MSWVVGSLLWLLARLPVSSRRGFGLLAGWVYSLLAADSRNVVIANMEHVRDGLLARGIDVGLASDFATRSMRTSGHLLVETAVCWRGRPGAWRGLIGSVEGEVALAALTSAHERQSRQTVGPDIPDGPGVLLLSPHLGNWELLNMYLGAEFGLTALYDPPKVAALEPLIRRARQRSASTLLPIGPSGLRGMVQKLRSGGVVGLLPDQVPTIEAGVYADFFGKQALTINLVHRLANKRDVRVFLVCALRNHEGLFDIRFDELTPDIAGRTEAEAAAAINAAIEARVVIAPEQYQWTYKRFKRSPGGQSSIYK